MSKVYKRIYTRGCERVRVHRVRKSRHASDGHERDRVYPPTFIMISANSPKSLSSVETYPSVYLVT